MPFLERIEPYFFQIFNKFQELHSTNFHKMFSILIVIVFWEKISWERSKQSERWITSQHNMMPSRGYLTSDHWSQHCQFLYCFYQLWRWFSLHTSAVGGVHFSNIQLRSVMFYINMLSTIRKERDLMTWTFCVELLFCGTPAVYFMTTKMKSNIRRNELRQRCITTSVGSRPLFLILVAARLTAAWHCWSSRQLLGPHEQVDCCALHLLLIILSRCLRPSQKHNRIQVKNYTLTDILDPFNLSMKKLNVSCWNHWEPTKCEIVFSCTWKTKVENLPVCILSLFLWHVWVANDDETAQMTSAVCLGWMDAFAFRLNPSRFLIIIHFNIITYLKTEK